MARDRVTVQEAASRLGVKDDAIRKRIQRGSLEHEKGEDGRVYVYMYATQDTTYDTSQDTAQDDLVEALRDQVSYLREQLDREREARTEERRRADTVIAQLSQANAEQAHTIRAIEAPQTSQEPPTPSPEASEGARAESTPVYGRD